MNYLRHTLAAFILCGLLLPMLGCTTPKKTAYTTLQLIGMTAEKATAAAADAHVAGKIDKSAWDKIQFRREKFDAAYRTACDIAAIDPAKIGTEELIRIQAELLQTINAILK